MAQHIILCPWIQSQMKILVNNDLKSLSPLRKASSKSLTATVNLRNMVPRFLLLVLSSKISSKPLNRDIWGPKNLIKCEIQV